MRQQSVGSPHLFNLYAEFKYTGLEKYECSFKTKQKKKHQ